MTYDREKILKKHPRFLKQQGYRCQFSGRIVGKRVAGRYRRYCFHHTSSTSYSREHCGWNYLLLDPFWHGVLHNLLGGAWFSDRDITVQNRRARMLPLSWLWRYPNPAQRLFHLWCRTPMIVRKIAIACLAIDWVWRLGVFLLSRSS